jgi:hypothetical protein
MSAAEDAIIAARGVLDAGLKLAGDLAIGNVDDDHPAAFDKTAERQHRVDQYARQVEGCRVRLEQQMPPGSAVVGLWVRAIEAIGWQIDQAHSGSYPSTSVSDQPESWAADDAVEQGVAVWDRAVADSLGPAPPGLN